ncbi:MAG: DUF805 domain-containing protein [Lactobacillales bacterium]|jgi:uncharacterized membrane protein YhaH (DUF805 family)|nr:DUF805 domain-containing protein [Lactobacillales bacterium]
MNYFNTYFVDVLKKQYADFKGRAIRSQYWYFFLFNMIISVILSIIDNIVFKQPALSSLYNLAVLVPGIAIAVRRLHDLGKSGWWLLLAFVPIVGAIVLLVWFCTKGETKSNAYGPALLK